MKLASRYLRRDAHPMESPQWLSDILELAELLLRLNQDDEADAEKVLEDLEKGAITLHYALEKLRQLH